MAMDTAAADRVSAYVALFSDKGVTPAAAACSAAAELQKDLVVIRKNLAKAKLEELSSRKARLDPVAFKREFTRVQDLASKD